MNADRKAIARAAEKSVRGMTAAALRKPSSVLEAPADKIAAIQASTELREAF
jgi:hypothetical protein